MEADVVAPVSSFMPVNVKLLRLEASRLFQLPVWATTPAGPALSTATPPPVPVPPPPPMKWAEILAALDADSVPRIPSPIAPTAKARATNVLRFLIDSPLPDHLRPFDVLTEGGLGPIEA